ncbi:ExbD/TolR family protein [Alloalcanivorax xenomutans]|uniref:ExbD/TolR family protein n=1 Tax=Alloalcanivorax xenomutans TaxID=1094342 RepID=UPI003BAD9ABD
MYLEPERHRSPAISLTPLIDVVFILLVFFMLATRFGAWKDLPVSVVPSEAVERQDDKTWLELHVNAEGKVDWNGEALSLEQLGERLAGHDEAVLITGDPDAPLQAALAAVDVARTAGLKEVQLELLP